MDKKFDVYASILRSMYYKENENNILVLVPFNADSYTSYEKDNNAFKAIDGPTFIDLTYLDDIKDDLKSIKKDILYIIYDLRSLEKLDFKKENEEGAIIVNDKNIHLNFKQRDKVEFDEIEKAHKAEELTFNDIVYLNRHIKSLTSDNDLTKDIVDTVIHKTLIKKGRKR